MKHSIGLPLVIAPSKPTRAPLMVACERWVWPMALALLLGSAPVAAAQPTPDEPQEWDSTATPDPALEKNAPSPKKRKLRGAITTVVGWGPDYLGASSGGLSYKPGFLLQYGRWSLSSNGAFAASAERDEGEELPQGLGFNLLGDDHEWLRLSLRVDSGRRSGGISGLRGIDDVPRTIRMRLSGQVNLIDGWALTPAANVDLLGRGVGHTLELALGKSWTVTKRTRFDSQLAMTYGTQQYLDRFFGVTPTEAATSGYAPYTPKAGLRDVRLGFGVHYDISARWVATANTGIQQLVGPAADSPLARSTTHWGFGAGLGWRF